MNNKFKELIKDIKIKKGSMKVDDYADAEIIHYESSVLFLNDQCILKIKDNGIIDFESKNTKNIFINYVIDNKIKDFLIEHNKIDSLSVFDTVHCIEKSNPTIILEDFNNKKSIKSFLKSLIEKSEQDIRAENFQKHTKSLILLNKKTTGYV